MPCWKKFQPDVWGVAEEVGKLAYQLGSEDSYLTGQIIQLDGGWI